MLALDLFSSSFFVLKQLEASERFRILLIWPKIKINTAPSDFTILAGFTFIYS